MCESLVLQKGQPTARGGHYSVGSCKCVSHPPQIDLQESVLLPPSKARWKVLWVCALGLFLVRGDAHGASPSRVVSSASTV